MADAISKAILNVDVKKDHAATSVSDFIKDVFGEGESNGGRAKVVLDEIGDKDKVDLDLTIEETLKSWGLDTTTTEEAAKSNNKAFRRGFWYDACVFACPHCYVKFFRVKKLQLHCRLEHPGLSKPDVDSCLVKKRTMECDACGEVIVRERKMVEAHLLTSHGDMTIRQFEKLYRSDKGKDANNNEDKVEEAVTGEEEGQLTLLKALEDDNDDKSLMAIAKKGMISPNVSCFERL